MAYLGVHQVRDGISDGLWGSAPLSSFTALAQKGITFTIGVIDGSVVDKASLDARLLLVQRLVQAVPGSVTAIEGANEINNWPVTYNGVTGLQGAVNLQKDLYAAVHSNPVFAGVAVDYFTGYGGTLGQGPNPATTPGLADYDTQHPYPLSGSAPAAWVDPARAASNEPAAVGPLVYTETGYSSNGGIWAGVDLSVQAKYTLDLVFDAAAKGVARTDLYELMDAYAAGSPQGNEGFGLFNTDNSPKPVATAIHNLTTILADRGPSGTAAAVAPTVTGLPATGKTMVLQKASGASDIVVWAEPQIWNPATGTEIAAPTTPVTVNLGATYASVAVFDPLLGTAPIATLANASTVQIGVSDHPLIVEVSGAVPQPTVAITAQALARDTGASSTDNITSNGAVTLSGTLTGAAGTAVRVCDGATSLGLATLGAGGTWSYATTLAAGTHTLTATAVDPAGRSATAATAGAITVLTATPSITLAGAVLASDRTTETLTGTVAGPAGTTVSVFNGTSLLGAAALDGKGSWSFSTALAPGSYHLTAVATDLAGNTAAVDPPVTVPAPVVAAVAATPATAADTLVLDLAEDAYLGDAMFTVSVDGTQVGGPTSVTARHALGQHQTFSFSGNYGTGPHIIGVNFLNDAWAGTAGMDRNLYVNAITFDGATTTENAAQMSQGLATYTILPVAAATATLAAAPIAAVAAAPAAADTLTLNVSEDAYRGDALFTVSLDGKQVGGPMTATASHRLGQGQDVVLTGNFGAGPHVVGVNFLNDAWGGTAATDRNLYVNSVTFNGTRTTLDAAQLSQGLASYLVKPPATTGNTLTLLLSEDAYKGDAQFTVSVDGRQVGGIETVSASHAAGQAQAFSLVGSFGTGSHAVAVNFLNDCYEGTARTDRNLYVKSITLDGGTTVANAAQLSGGARAYQVQSGSAGALGAFQVAANATLILASDAPAGASVGFAGPGTLELTDAGSFHGAITGFGQGDVLDLRSIACGSTTALSLNAAGTVLSVTDGSHAASLTLTGNYTAANFALSGDTHGGTAVAFVPSLARAA